MTILTLDPAHPALDDHRPGAHPLFGTAMGIGALVEAGAVSALHRGACRVEAVRVHAPYILDHAGPHRLTVDVAASGEGTVCSGARMLHFEGRIMASAAPGIWQVPAMPGMGTSQTVDQDRIYQAFFHGPTFQVVGAARFCGSALFARLADAPAPGAIAQVSRLIEFGLQSAGLLELAISGRMMIPSTIDSIEVFDFGDAPTGATVLAQATQAPETPTISRSDIAIWAEPGVPLMQISGYRTVELPFPVELAKIAALRRSLLETE